ncbi:hypothetical protein MPEAHAMD_6738 [Methylobacterium frigidaeris]|uniref:DUF1259 domain-containing protein n=1 Tax=Methylobacterium frigidaeris TaxID=2038277 RepID=A0AA37HK03_9HYPH|nr:hypothetical protein MPEAHAMD_6738 [Methylobacterium frigidaeris]
MRSWMMAFASILGLVALALPAQAAESWQQAIASGLGKPGMEMPGGVYRVGLPRTDLKVTLDGVAIKPALALGSWLAFQKVGENQVMVMGDLVLTEDEVNPVMACLHEGGVEITALHNHLLRASPSTLYMHVSAHGEPGKLATTLMGALGASRTPFGAETAGGSTLAGAPGPASAGEGPVPARATAPDQALDLDTAAIDQALGRKGKVNGELMTASDPRPFRVVLVWWGDAAERAAAQAETTRLKAIFAALGRQRITAEPAVWSDALTREVRAQLMGMDGVLVWVKPISSPGRNGRGALDELLREVATAGIFVSAHPDVIARMGTKEVLFQTRSLGWGTDTYVYRDLATFEAEFPARVAAGPRVLKRNRGNGGQGVWKAEQAAGTDLIVQEAWGERRVRTMPLDTFVAERAASFAETGTPVDQPFQARHLEGMIRGYLSGDQGVASAISWSAPWRRPKPGRLNRAATPGRMIPGFSACEPCSNRSGCRRWSTYWLSTAIPCL